MLCLRCGTPNDADELDCTGCGVSLLLPKDLRGAGTLFFPPNRSAVTAYYLGVFSVIPLVGIPAFILGLKGLRYAKEHPEARGAAHAWTGVILGALFTLAYAALAVMLLRAKHR